MQGQQSRSKGILFYNEMVLLKFINVHVLNAKIGNSLKHVLLITFFEQKLIHLYFN